MVVKRRSGAPRSRLIGVFVVFISIILAGIFVYSVFIISRDSAGIRNVNLVLLEDLSYYSLVLPILLVSLLVIGTGFWIGWTILTIKVVPSMPEIIEKRDFSKVQAFFLCLFTLAIAVLLIYGVYIRSFWALAIPAAAITLVVLGAVFWVGVAIITTRSTLPEEKKSNDA